MTSSSDRDAFTEAWYRERAEAFADRTRDMAMAKFHDDFLARLPDGGRILDVGCGSGRDAKAFRERGYEVEGLERSPELARMAEQHAGCPVRIMSMEELEDDGRFDGLWASASVLHIPIEARAGLLTRFLRALRPGGTLYLSLKEGGGRRIDAEDGRVFYDIRAKTLEDALISAGFVEPEGWRTTTVGSRVPGQVWVNGFARRPADDG